MPSPVNTVRSWLELQFSVPDVAGRTTMILMVPTWGGLSPERQPQEYIAIQMPVSTLEDIVANLKANRPAKTLELVAEFYGS